jgi:hypothetical protein
MGRRSSQISADKDKIDATRMNKNKIESVSVRVSVSKRA